MVSSTLPQVLATSIDALGLSTVTSVRSATDPRPGAVYDNAVLAAAVPVHFHPMTAPALGGANVMMLNSLRWRAATPAATNPGRFSAYTVDTMPSWLLVNAANGHSFAVNSGVGIPMTTPADSATLTGAVSRGVDMLYTLNKVVLGPVTSAVIAHWHNNTAINTLNAINEETIPAGANGSDAIIFSAGVHYSAATDPYLYVYGIGSVTHALYMARKPWARVGLTGTATRPVDGAWEVFTGTGFSTDFTAARPIQAGLLSYGPVSVANHALPRSVSGKTTNYTFMATTQASGPVMTAQIYSSLGGRPWQPVGAPIGLGSTGSTYLGATVQLQPQLGANAALVSPTAAAAIPYVLAIKNTSGGSDQIAITWGLFQVPRVS